jgi:hypothetical protein
MNLGSVYYRYIYKPVLQPLKRLKADGGFYGRYRLLKGEREMKEAAMRLSMTCSSSAETAYPYIHFLTGKKHWYQTVFCIYSLLSKVNLPLHIVIHDDGTIDDKFAEMVRRQVRNCSIVFHRESEARVERALPREQFPYLRSARDQFPLFYKLIDCRLGFQGPQLLLDSDMLFFHEPLRLTEWLLQPTENIYMQDKFHSYQYSYPLLDVIATTPIKRFVNSGVTGIDNDLIDWNILEGWAKRLIEAEGISYFFEQTLYALFMTEHNSRSLPENDYILIPTRSEVEQAVGEMHHYPTGFRNWYFRSGWRKQLT